MGRASQGPVTVVLGAGASFDCAGASTSPNPAWRPPLAAHLFDIERNQAFERVLNRYQGAKFHAAELAELSRTSSFELESELHKLRDDPRFGDIVRYLADLLGVVSRKYVRSPSQYIRLIRDLESVETAVLVSLNYDTLLEQALTISDARYRFDSVESYFAGDRQFKVFKPHGSCNWFREREGSFLGGIKVSEAQLPRWGRPSIEPVLTAPVVQKSAEDVVHALPNGALPGALRMSRKILFIGTSGMDSHMLTMLKANLTTGAQVFVVTKEDHVVVAEDEHVVVTKDDRTAQQRICAGLGRSECQAFIGGFAAWFESTHHDIFFGNAP